MKSENLNKTIIGGSIVWWFDPKDNTYSQTATFLLKNGMRDQEVLREGVSVKEYFILKLKGELKEWRPRKMTLTMEN